MGFFFFFWNKMHHNISTKGHTRHELEGIQRMRTCIWAFRDNTSSRLSSNFASTSCKVFLRAFSLWASLATLSRRDTQHTDKKKAAHMHITSDVDVEEVKHNNTIIIFFL